MKKVISLILSIMMLGTLTVPALAADSQDEALKKVTLAVKNTLGIDDSFTDFSGNLSDEGSFSYWSLNWSKDDVSISVNADPNGKILAYSKNQDYDYSGSAGYAPVFPKASRDQLQAAAKTFVEKLLTKNETIAFSSSGGELGTQKAMSYQFTGNVYLNGLKSPDTFYVEMRPDDLSVSSFRRYYLNSSYLAGAPSPIPSIAADKAASLFKDNTKLRLQYVLSADGKTAVLQYLPLSTDDIAVDASTGALVSLQMNTYYENGSTADAANPSAKGASGLSEVEQSAIDALGGVYSKSELDAAVRTISSLGIDSAYNLDSARYVMDKSTGKVECTLQYSKKISDEGTMQARFPDTYSSMKAAGTIYPIGLGKSVTVDAKTKALMSLYTYKDSDKEASVQSKDQMKANAETFLTAYCADKFKASAYNEADSSALDGSFIYSQSANSILFPTNSIYVSVNKYDGSIDSFSTGWTDGVSFTSADGIVNADKAKDAYCAGYKAVLQYVTVPAEISKTASTIYPKYNTDGKLLLAYKYESDNYVIGVDAKTGKVITQPASGTQTPAYTDLTGSYGKAQIEKLALYGIGFSGTVFQPTVQLTQKDAITLLLSAVGYTTDNEDSLYQAAYSYKMLTKAEKSTMQTMTRAEFVKMLIGATEYGSAAKLVGIYKCGFRDDSKISSAYLGYVSIAKALKVVNGDALNRFNPDSIISRQDAAIMLYNFMSR